MSFINFLGLEDSGYGNFAKGILYVICELLWKVVQATSNLIDAITGLFYKLAGLDYMGSGSETLVKEEDLLTQLFNQNIVSKASLVMIGISVAIMIVFGVASVVKYLYFSKCEMKSMLGIIKNMVLAFIFLLCLGPLALFSISSISAITTAIAGVFGTDTNVSLADVVLNSSFSDSPIDAYNSIYSAKIEGWENITSWVEMTKSDFLFELIYGGSSTTNFYWYLFFLGGGIVLYNLIIIVLRLVKRLFNVIILYILGPIYAAKMVDDGGVKFREWKNKALGELVSIVGTVVGFMILLSLVSMIDNLELIGQDVEVNAGAGNLAISGLANVVEQENVTINLINNLTKMLLLIAGTSVAKDSGELLANVFKTNDESTNILLENLTEKVVNKEIKASGSSGSSVPRTRVITKNTTTTRTFMDYGETIPTSSVIPKVNVTNNQSNSLNANITNIDDKVTNFENKTNVSLTNRVVTSDENVKVGNLKTVNTDDFNTSKFSTMEMLNQGFNSIKQENDRLKAEWGFMKNSNSSSSREVVREFESASKELDSSIMSGEQVKIKDSMSKYVEAYKNEEKIAKAGYNDFAGKSSKLSSDLNAQQQEELRRISAAYKKAQIDYGKTAQKLSQVSSGNMSAADALRVKEKADKQREKLMNASSKANDFYNNQKKGV